MFDAKLFQNGSSIFALSLLLASANVTAVARANTTSLSGSNTVSATQATALTALHNFTLASGATLLVSDTAANLLAGSFAAGVAIATSLALTGNVSTAAVNAVTLCAIWTDGTLWCWGDNTFGQRGNGYAWRTRPSPIE